MCAAVNGMTRGRRVTPGVSGEIWFVAALTLLAGFMRLLHLDAVPPGLHGDEALTGLDALRILRDGWIGPYVPSALGQPAGPLYWTALLFKIAGVSVSAMRLSMALLGVATIPAAYMAYRTMFNRRVACWGIVLLTGSHWHIFYSRTGFMLISHPLAEMACLFCLFAGLRSQRGVFFALGGVSLGAVVYSYNTFFLFVCAIGAFMLILIKDSQTRRTPQFHLSLTHAISFWGAFLLAALPMMMFAISTPKTFSGHFRINNIFHDAGYLRLQTSTSKLLFLGERLYQAWQVLLFPRGIDAVDGYGAQAILNPIMGGLLIAGVALLLVKFRDRRHQLLLIMLMTGALAVTFSIPWHGQYRRWVGAIPALFAIQAIALDRIMAVFQKRTWKAIAGAALLLLLGWGAVRDVNAYFAVTPSQAFIRWVYCTDLVQALRYVKEAGMTQQRIYFLAARWPFNYETRRFLIPEAFGEDRSQEYGRLDLHLNPNEASGLFLILSPYEYVIPELQAIYPDGTLYERRENGQFVFAAYQARCASVAECHHK